MSELALTLILSGWKCPPIECAEVYINDVYSIACIDGRAYEPITMPGPACVRMDIESDSAT